MGDSRISYTIIFKDDALGRIRNSHTLSADSTLSEVISHLTSTITNHQQQKQHQQQQQKECSYTFHNDNDDDNNNDNQQNNIQLNLYDCTTYPPKQITSNTINQYKSNVGPTSITIQKMNWFPSAKLYICQSDDEVTISSILSSNIHLNYEYEYNNNPDLISKEKEKGMIIEDDDQRQKGNVKIRLTGDLGAAISSTQKPLPSQLLKAVEGLSHDDEKTSTTIKQRKRRTEEERRKLLDLKLEQLDQRMNDKNKKKKSKNKKVSDQVKKMLIKSRSEGNKKIRMEDRFYLDVVLLDESQNTGTSADTDDSTGTNVIEQDNMSSLYVFHSRVSTIGKVVTGRVKSLADARDKGAELLILTSSSSTTTTEAEAVSSTSSAMVYKRLPPTLPLYEAESKGYIQNFGRVIVRIFKADVDSVSSCYTESV